MDSKLQSLPNPDITHIESAFEIMRVWIDGDVQKFSILTDVWDDPAAWGFFFVDLVRHTAYSISQQSNQDFGDILKRIKYGFDIEWKHPTDEV
jgi:hypothetical protein